MLSWENTGFNVYCGEAIYAEEQESIEKLAQYVVRAPISQERMFYIPPEESSNEVGKIIYKGKNSREIQAFDALDWLARLVTHIPNKGEQFVRYYGYYSNKSRGQRKKAETDDKVPAIVSSDLSKKAFCKNWARLIQKVYNVDPLKCKYCNGKMRIISFVEDEETIEKILKHLKLWGIQNHDPPNHFKIPQQFEHFILANSLLIGNNEKSNENMGKNKDGNYEEHNSNNVFPDYETCDEMPKYEDWF
ncbi:transposase [Acetivibrio clariflavus]|uniref:transposase n=1 Tax=Acetivibrio clariflavus TaxID=288965 RepID=UPI00030311E6|nr:transposase [Acetivibrio clariflavus]